MPMSGGGDPVGGGVQATDDRGGTHLPGATEGTGTVQGVRGGYGGGIFGGSQYDTAWESGRSETELENLSHGGRSVDILHGLTGQGRPVELPGGGMPRLSGDEDGNVGPFSAPACTGHSGKFIGGKPPPPTVTLMRHAGPPPNTERKAPCHRTVREGRGAKEAAASRDGAEGEHGEGLQGLRKTSLYVYLLQIPGAGIERGGQKLAIGSGVP